jgi:hypothetical protein
MEKPQSSTDKVALKYTCLYVIQSISIIIKYIEMFYLYESNKYPSEGFSIRVVGILIENRNV